MSLAMTEKLNRSAREGNVDALYSILAEHDDDSIADTPLHKAASVGNTHYAMEIATLKPPLARQLNRQGLSPMHVALQNRHKQVVRALLAIDRELVRVKGKGRITPLHYVAEMEDLDLLAEFLYACPSSIEDLTVQCETAVHVAVKNKRLAVVEVLMGWLIRINNKEVLQWKDEDGNTVLHIATSTKQPKVMELLIKHVKVNAKNFHGLTAMDIFYGQEYSPEREILGKILRRAGAKSAFCDASTTTFASYLRKPLSRVERWNNILGISGQDPTQSSREVLLLVATLIATSTFQAVLNPPLQLWQADTGLKTTKNPKILGMNARLTNSDRQSDLYTFFSLNTIAFFTSFYIILLAITDLPFAIILYPSAMFLSYTYYGGLVNTILYSRMNPNNLALRYVFTFFTTLCLVMATVIPLGALVQHRWVRRKVDVLKRHLGGFISTNETNQYVEN